MIYLYRCLIILFAVFLCACSIPTKIHPGLNLTKKVQLNNTPRVALVLGGGGARGFAHLGVIKALEEARIPIDLIVGTSVGSLVGGLYAADPKIDHLTTKVMKSSYPDYFDISLSQAICGPITGTRLQRFIVNNTHGCGFQQLKIPFIAVATDINSGKTIPISSGRLSLAINASCAIPTVIQPVQFSNVTLVDGGLTDPVPVDIARCYKPKVIIAVNITGDLVNNCKITMPSLIKQSLNIMMLTLTRYNLQNADVVIRPRVGSFSMFDLSKKEKLYRTGLSAGRKAIPRIRKLLDA